MNISYYEEILNDARRMIGGLRLMESSFSDYDDPSMTDARNAFLKMQPRIRELSSYYGSPAWKQDLADDEAGKLPAGLPRGVLSEDGIYNLLSDNDELMKRLFESGPDVESGLPARLSVPRGITSVIGGGGKTTLLRRLAGELDGRVLLVTSTNMQPLDEFPVILWKAQLPDARKESPASFAGRIRDAFTESRIVCAGSPALTNGKPNGKLAAVPCDLRTLTDAADYILVEADGSKHLPFKAHKPWEPVIPEGTEKTICVVGASGFGKPVREVCHRPDVFCELTGASMDDTVTPELVGEVIRKENFPDLLYLTQTGALPAASIPEIVSALSRASRRNVTF